MRATSGSANNTTVAVLVKHVQVFEPVCSVGGMALYVVLQARKLCITMRLPLPYGRFRVACVGALLLGCTAAERGAVLKRPDAALHVRTIRAAVQLVVTCAVYSWSVQRPIAAAPSRAIS